MRKLPIPDILMLILDRGRMSKDEIQRMWAVTDEEYAALRTRLSAEKLIRPAPGRGGGFEAVFGQRSAAAAEESSAPLSFASPAEAEAARVLAQFLTHADVEELLGDLLYTIRRARFLLTREDRRGTKEELIAALLTQHGVDLLADKGVRDRVGRRVGLRPPGRWHAGKTRTAVDTIRDWLTTRHGERGSGAGCVVLWLAHTEELCEQAATCFREVWQGSHEVCPLLLFRFWGGYTRDLLQHRETLLSIRQRPAVLVSTPQRLVNLAEGKLPGGDAVLESLRELVGLVVIDEAHRAAAPMYRKLMGFFGGGPEAPGIIGLTATPFRHSTDATRPESGMLELRELFGTILEPVETLGEEPRQTLQRRGFLAQPVFTSLPTRTRLRPPEGVNTEDPNDEDTERSDFALKMRADQPDRRLIALEHMVGLCQSPEALVMYFGPTVRDAECMAFLLRQQGITAAFVSGDTREVTRRKIIRDFRSGRTQVLCNCEVLTTGCDAPRVTHVVMARPTVSQVLYEQMVGRGLRGPAFGGTETCQVIDMEDQYRAGRPELGYKRVRALWGAG